MEKEILTEVTSTEEVVTPITEEVISSDIPRKETTDKENKIELAKEFVKLFSICFKFASSALQGKALKEKFEIVENSLRKYEKKESENLKTLEEKVNTLREQYKAAARKFEAEAMTKLDPSLYDKEVAPIEQEYLVYKKHWETKIAHVQNIKMLKTRAFAREKSLIPTLQHSQAIITLVLIFRSYLVNGTLEIVYDEKDVETVKEIETTLSKIFESKYLKGEFTDIPTLDQFIEYFSDIVETQVDKAFVKAKVGKDNAFGLIDKLVEELHLPVIPTDFQGDIDPKEVEIIELQNKLKLLEEVVRTEKYKNEKGEIVALPKSTKATIVEATRACALFINGGVLSMLDEEMLKGLQFKEQGLANFYKVALPHVAGQLYANEDMSKVDKTTWYMVVSWLFLSTSVVDTIPTLLLMI